MVETAPLAVREHVQPQLERAHPAVRGALATLQLDRLATGLAAGILIDATVIRSLLVPATVSLFGRWNWVLPTGAARVLRVEPSLPPRTPAPAPA